MEDFLSSVAMINVILFLTASLVCTLCHDYCDGRTKPQASLTDTWEFEKLHSPLLRGNVVYS